MGVDEVRAHVIEWEAGRQAEFLRMLFARWIGIRPCRKARRPMNRGAVMF